MSTKPQNPQESWYASIDKTSATDDQRVGNITVLPPPEHLIRFFPISGTPTEKLIGRTREKIRNLIHGKDDRLLVIIGPCSIHDPAAAVEYCQRLLKERSRLSADLEIVMRVYFEKPRTTVGWKGLINDPYLDESFKIEEGLRIARQVLMEINRLGMPAGSEFLDVISPLSHANSSKQHQRQIDVANDIAEQIESGSKHIFGVMIESHLHSGAQKFTPGKDDPKALEYGKSITDACINWDDSVQVLERLAEAVRKRRRA